MHGEETYYEPDPDQGPTEIHCHPDVAEHLREALGPGYVVEIISEDRPMKPEPRFPVAEPATLEAVAYHQSILDVDVGMWALAKWALKMTIALSGAAVCLFLASWAATVVGLVGLLGMAQ